VEVQDGVTATARMSLNEPTRIRVDGAAIIDIVGNVFHRDRNPQGEISIDEDRQRGEIFVSLVRPQPKPVNLFVMTGQATYTLLLQPSDIPAETVVLVDRTKRTTAPVITDSSVPVQAIRNLIAALATDRPSGGMRVTELHRDVPLRDGLRMSLQRRIEAGPLVGERYVVVNVSPRAHALAEQQFYRRGLLAVSIERAALAPQESTAIYIVRAPREDE
jgi:conjugal transfer pilus assembly protein TraK